jgi:hypothetical protein
VLFGISLLFFLFYRHASFAGTRLQTVAVFCHGGFGLTWMAWLLGIPVAQAWSSFYLAPSSVTTILMDERSTERAVPRALAVSDVGHLYAEGLTISNSKYEKPNRFTSEPRPSGIKANFF